MVLQPFSNWNHRPNATPLPVWINNEVAGKDNVGGRFLVNKLTLDAFGTRNLLRGIRMANILLVVCCSLVMAVPACLITAAEPSDPDGPAIMQAVQVNRVAAIGRLRALIDQPGLSTAQRRKTCLAMPVTDVVQAFAFPMEVSQQALLDYILEEVIMKTDYERDAELTYRICEWCLALMSAADGLVDAKLMKPADGIATQILICREFSRWSQAVAAPVVLPVVTLTPGSIQGWSALASNEYLAAAHGRLHNLVGPPDQPAVQIMEQRSLDRFIRRLKQMGKMERWWKAASPADQRRLIKACTNSPLSALLPDVQGKQP